MSAPCRDQECRYNHDAEGRHIAPPGAAGNVTGWQGARGPLPPAAFAAPVGQSSDPQENTASGYARRAAAAARGLAQMLDRATVEARRGEIRAHDAEARLEDVQRLFWLLAARLYDFPLPENEDPLLGLDGPTRGTVVALAAALGIEDCARVDVRLELQKLGLA